MLESYRHDGLVFEVEDRGPTGGPALIALHGFPQDRHSWDELAGPLVASGRRLLAPDQRGYSPGARPVPRSAYTRAKLSADVLALADAAGVERFDLLGHDWGGLVAWDLAANSPDRVRSVAVLSTPHPAAFRAALVAGGQLWRSWYMGAMQVPWFPEAAARLAGTDRIARSLREDGIDASSALRYAARLSVPESARGPINWYRAMPLDLQRAVPRVAVPTLYVWGARDPYLSRHAALATEGQVTGPYTFEIFEDSGHWLPECDGPRVSDLLLGHLDHSAGEWSD